MGVTVTPSGVNFSIFSQGAKSVTLILFNKLTKEEIIRISLNSDNNKTGDIWHVAIENLDHNNIEYGYLVGGAYEEESGNRVDCPAILLDPYAQKITGAESWGVDYFSADYDGKKRTAIGIRCGINDGRFDWGNDTHPNIPMEELIIYELHARGFTKDLSSKVDKPGTFHGLVEMLPYLQDLGVNAIELMPIHEFVETGIHRHNPENQQRLYDYWGYSTIAFFAPKASYAATGKQGGQIEEFKELVLAFHKSGLEVILDVVFNHTAEGDESGPILSFKGLGNSIYYMLDEEGKYKNFSGCGNTLNCNHPIIREMIRNCLRYWVTEFHIDGFRFDLASILSRSTSGEPLLWPPLLEIITLDPVLSKVKLIAEAWDAAGLYQVGSFPSWGRWYEWNGKYRDCARRFLRGDKGQVGELATRISGSPDLYQGGGRKPYHSINFITCHDGFTLYDLFAYNEKHNVNNGENNMDGANDNWSNNQGHEGPTDDQQIKTLRYRQMKNAVSLLMLSQGVPMLFEGDEICRSKNGNNNSYCHDSPINWIDWTQLEKEKSFYRFVRAMIRFRKSYRSLRRKDYYTGEPNSFFGTPDIAWHGVKHEKPDWSVESKCLAFTISGQRSGEGKVEPDIYAAFNSDGKDQKFELPKVESDLSWWRVVDTAQTAPDDFLEENDQIEVRAKFLSLVSYSCQILVLR
tara:strand:- start:229876 stop:231939 length:2064 start_codon:yes stop_codon:yes gene_type:complete